MNTTMSTSTYNWLTIAEPVNDIEQVIDQRDFFRLKLSSSDPLDACVVLENGESHTMEILNISASGIYCKTTAEHNFMQETKLTAFLVLPLHEPLILKIPCRLVEVKCHPVEQNTLIRLRFLPSLEMHNQEMIHRFIITRQLQELRTENTY